MSDTPDAPDTTATTAIEAEAADSDTIAVEWTIPERLRAEDGPETLTFDIPRDHLDWPLDAELALRSDDPIALAETFMGDGFGRLRSLRPTNRDVVDLSRTIISALGFGSAGESAASSD